MLHPAPMGDALIALALGGVLGLIYDLLRPPRRALKRAAFLADLAFCSLAAAGAFSLAMRDPLGRFGLWSVAASVAGFLLWLSLASPRVAPAVGRLWTAVAKLGRVVEKNAKKSLKSAKILFSKFKSRYIINERNAESAPGERQ